MKHLDEKYQDILLDLINNGVEKEDRTGTGTLSVFGKQFRHNMADGFPTINHKENGMENYGNRIAMVFAWRYKY